MKISGKKIREELEKFGYDCSSFDKSQLRLIFDTQKITEELFIQHLDIGGLLPTDKDVATETLTNMWESNVPAFRLGVVWTRNFIKSKLQKGGMDDKG